MGNVEIDDAAGTFLTPLYGKGRIHVRVFVTAFAAVVVTAVSASAGSAIPQFRASCPTDILVAGGGSTVFINGKQANVKTRGANSFTATAGNVTVDFLFEGGEPSLSYTGPHGANGMCTVTKFAPAAAATKPNQGGVDPKKMEAECKGFASEKFGVRPSYVSVHPAFRDHGMYSMYGNADDKNFICTFDGQGKFVAVDPTSNPDGDL